MKLLQEISKLIPRQHTGAYSFTYTVEDLGDDTYYLGDFDVDVTFDYTPEDYTQHVPGDPTTRERHPADVEVVTITLADDVHAYDHDGEKVLKTFPKGMPADQLPGWNAKIESRIEDAAFDNLPEDDGDYDYDDRYDSRW
jgi:hypothetical protein